MFPTAIILIVAVASVLGIAFRSMKARGKTAKADSYYHHEARHAVVSFLLGKGISEIYADHERGEGHVENTDRGNETAEDHRDIIRIAMAGGLASNGMLRGGDQDQSYQDALNIEAIIRDHPEVMDGYSSEEHFRYEMKRDAYLLVKENKDLVERVAGVLKEKKHLNADEAYAVLSGK